MVLQVVIVVTGVGYAAHRYQQLTAPHMPPVPNNDPIQVGPLYDRPDVITDEQLVALLQRLKPRLRVPHPRINHIDHALRFWGVEATFDDPECLSGVEMRELLLDHRAFQQAWGPEERPFLIPDTTADADMLSFRTMSGPASASHYDHTIAGLGEVGTPLDFPVITPDGERPLRAALDYSLRSFSLNQTEYEWSTLAYLLYMPDVPQWYTSEGQIVTWDRLARRIMRQRLAKGVCFGNHRLHTLVMMLRVDREQYPLFSDAVREEVVAHLRDATDRLIRTQHEDGYWDGRWPGEEWDGPQPSDLEGPFGPTADRLLATGHALEWLALEPPELLPPDDVLQRAGQWVCETIATLSESQLNSYYPFLTHAGRALTLWRGKFPYQVPLPSVTESGIAAVAADAVADFTDGDVRPPEASQQQAHDGAKP